MGVRAHLMGTAGILALALLLGGCGEPGPGSRAETVSDPSAVAATVNGQPIYISEVNLEAEAQNLVERGGTLEVDSAEFNQVLDGLIDVKLLAMEAESRGLDADPQAQHRLESARLHILGNILVDAVVAERVDETAIRKMYDAQIAIWELGEEARVRHILTATREDADKAAAEVRGGADFAVVASRRSADEATRMDGGDIGYLSEDDATPEFAAAIRQTETGGISRPFQTDMGWHIIKVEERREERPPSLDELREPILKHLTTVQIGEVLKELRTSGRIQKLTAPQNSSLEVDPFRDEPAARPAPAPAPQPVEPQPEPAPAPGFEAAAPAGASPAPAQPVAPAVVPPAPVSESREGEGE
jgi:peptidyl-prolyl cis-trans isomerase C